MSYEILIEALQAIPHACQVLADIARDPNAKGNLADVTEPDAPGSWALSSIGAFWRAHDTAQRLLDEIPAGALEDLQALSGGPWKLTTRRALDAIAKPLQKTRWKDKQETLRAWREIRCQYFLDETWIEPVPDLKRLTADLVALRGERYGAAAGLTEAGNQAAPADSAALQVTAAVGAESGDGAGDVGGGSEVAHSDDFRSVKWGVETFSFTVSQAPVVRLLYENWKRETPDVGDETLLQAVDPEAPPARLSVLFRDNKAWNKMIVQGGSKGTHRLADPPQEKPRRA